MSGIRARPDIGPQVRGAAQPHDGDELLHGPRPAAGAPSGLDVTQSGHATTVQNDWMDTANELDTAPLRAQLLQRVADLREMLGRQTEEFRGGAEAPADFKEAAERDEQAVVQDLQAAHAAHELELVHAALRRLAAGTYGTCMDCGEPIAQERLRTIPFAARCAPCQAAHDRDGR